MNKALLFLAISSVILSAPVVMAQSFNNSAPDAAPPNPTPGTPIRAIPNGSDSGVTSAMYTDMAVLQKNMAKMQEQMTTIDTTTNMQMRQKLMQEQLLTMHEHLRAMQTLMGHLGNVQSRVMPSH